MAPAGTCAVLTTAPTPVSTAQPNSAASSNGSSGSILTSERRDTTAYSANAEQPRWWLTRRRRRCSRRAPESSVPAPLAAAPGSHSAGPALGAGQAVAAARHEDQDHVVAAGEVGDALADLLDHAGRLVAERHRHAAAAGRR